VTGLLTGLVAGDQKTADDEEAPEAEPPSAP
jgi:hypothetical protein